MNLYGYIDIAKKVTTGNGQPIQESKPANNPQTSIALEMARRMGKNKPSVEQIKSLGAMPVPN